MANDNGSILTKVNEATGLGKNIIWIVAILVIGYAQYVSFKTHVNDQIVYQKLIDQNQDDEIKELKMKTKQNSSTNLKIQLTLKRIETELSAVHKDIIELKQHILKN